MLSSYNHYKKIDDEVIIYNSLSDKLEKITEQDFVNLTETRCDANISDEILTRLYKNDMLVDKYQDESAKTIHRYNKATFSNQLHIVLLVTTDCNFSCNYCYQDYDKMYVNSTFIDAFSKFIENNIMKYDGIYIEWFGGEPLLMRKKVIELSTKIQDICKSNNIPYIGTITTNGFYLDEKTALNLIKSGIKFFQVTLDGDEQSHNVLRKSKNGKGSYDRITTNLINIKQNLPSNLFLELEYEITYPSLILITLLILSLKKI
ncbi:radical SAM protein [Streptococcus thermophilus]|nr:4Fe-4S cluster-binding domain-containing protein [Streptococcus thermophilus]MCE2064479.1 4Fe-4S cluster-binding domain-containing protein [Streptococcus thermophilus]MCE2072989.1 4Fe-4S cluster-binding domain-containing protein [Streptococcus thermophilus]MCE2077902.1 4Fe-4S cluster-binding domain-containing protein [Streptococcus thermophilus]MCE2081180.1 4Fe-4S cluster-binding domain-containing protein [Streptococcus thermophilus]